MEDDQPYYIAPYSEEKPVGIALTQQIINPLQKRASLSFARPLRALNDLDLDFEVGKAYIFHITWGIFPNDPNVDKSVYGDKILVRGEKLS